MMKENYHNVLSDNISAKHEKNELWYKLIFSVIHHINTPLSVIRMHDKVIRTMLPDLIQGYMLALENNLIEDTVNHNHIKSLKERSFSGIYTQLEELSDFLKGLYENVRFFQPTKDHASLVSVKECLAETLKGYSLDGAEAISNIINKVAHDFMVPPIKVVLKYLLEVMIKDLSDESTDTPKIIIWTEKIAKSNILYFEQHLSTSQDYDMKWISERFINCRDNKTSMGLGFCRLALLELGGSLEIALAEDETVKTLRLAVKFGD